MKDVDCVRFLQWALPQLGKRWPGFRKVHRQICKRIKRRFKELGLSDISAYQDYLATHPDEWSRLDALCTIPISRFYRDKRGFDCLRREILPSVARRAMANAQKEVRCWSAGCAAGEEAYTLKIVWNTDLSQRFRGLSLRVIGTDVDENLLRRARAGSYGMSSLKDLPPELLETAFTRSGKLYCVRESFRDAIDFRRQDIRTHLPAERFDIILCRNLVFTYFDEPSQRKLLPRITERLVPGGALVIGSHESLPEGTLDLTPWVAGPGIFRKKEEGKAC